MPDLPEKIIDFHVHLFPDKLFDALWATFATHYQWDVIHKIYSRECVAHLHRNDVSPVVYSNYAHKKGIADGLNRWNLSLLDEYPDLYCFAAFHPDDDNCLELAEQVLAHPRVLGFKLQFLVQHFYPGDERLFPLYELVIERNKRILFHIGTGPVGNQYVGMKNFTPVLKRYPELPANVAHMGAFEYQAFMDLLDDHPQIYLDTAFTFFKNIDMGFNLDGSYLERYKDRIVYGSDFPNLILPREEEINALLELDLCQAFYDNIFFNNGMALIARHSGKSRDK